jgi:hypothetical protein
VLEDNVTHGGHFFLIEADNIEEVKAFNAKDPSRRPKSGTSATSSPNNMRVNN